MIDSILSIVAPHHCCGCDKVGSLLCGDCKYNIISEPFGVCLVCLKPVSAKGLCNRCRVPYSHAWVVGKRSDVLQRLIDLYKFERTQAASVTLGDLLLSVLPDLPAHTVVVPVPTISSHIRQRGYDHMKRIARYVAKKRRLTVSYDLIRRTHTTQRSASAAQRKVQAKEAFAVRKPLSNTSPYLLIDDIYTTGSTVRYAAQTLKDAGASDVWVAIIARQTLD